METIMHSYIHLYDASVTEVDQFLTGMAMFDGMEFTVRDTPLSPDTTLVQFEGVRHDDKQITCTVFLATPRAI